MSVARSLLRVTQWGKSLWRSITLRLFLWIFAVILVAFSAYAAVALKSTARQWNGTVHNSAQRLSELILRSTHHSMRINRKQDLQQILRTIADAPGVEGVRLYDKQGAIIASGNADEVGQRVDLEAEACVICHDQALPLAAVPAESRVRIYTGADGRRVLGLIHAVRNEPDCSAVGCHVAPAERSILGVLDVKLSMAEADSRLATVERQLLTAGLLVALAAGAASALFLLPVVRRPVRRLVEGTRRVARGDLDSSIAVDGRDEIAELARAFNGMTDDLRRARAELERWSARLERRLVDKQDELGRTQRQVVHMERMASLGKLAATVAHELNNPLAGILNYATLVERTLREGGNDDPELARWLELIRGEARRSGTIVRDLLRFARRSGSRLSRQPIRPVVERALLLVRHHLELAAVRLELDLAEGDADLDCDADELQQALVALAINAVEAMPGGGTLTVRTQADAENLTLEVADTGLGIAPEHLPHVFEPFFSTKQDAAGAGLGLAVVYGIVQRHHGTIDADSEIGRGAAFRIVLPRRAVAQEVRHAS